MNTKEKAIDPKWYKQDGSEIKRVIKILLIILAIAAGIIWYSTLMTLPGEVKLNSSMSIETADELVQKAGYIPKDEIKSTEDCRYRFYESSELFGIKTLGSEVCAVETPAEAVYFTHYFADENEQNNAETPGSIFFTVKGEMTRKFGKKPTEAKTPKGRTVWYWIVNKKEQAAVMYVEDGMFELRYTFEE